VACQSRRLALLHANAGFPKVREVLAERLRRHTGLDFQARHLLMTVGSSGAINTALKAILDPGDEVIVPMPCFSEYQFYIANHSGKMVPVETAADFSLDLDAIRAAITPRTRAINLNSPHQSHRRDLLRGHASWNWKRCFKAWTTPWWYQRRTPTGAFVYDGAVMPETGLSLPTASWRILTPRLGRWRASASATWLFRRGWRARMS
jgi:hypothetical protein